MRFCKFLTDAWDQDQFQVQGGLAIYWLDVHIRTFSHIYVHLETYWLEVHIFFILTNISRSE